jgi:hypothetical protein
MKSLWYIIILLAWACTFAWAAPVTLAWDYDGEGATYEVYRGIEMLGATSHKTITADVNAGDVLHVLAVYPSGLRSAKSETVTIAPSHLPPPAPTRFRVVIDAVVTIHPASP